MCYKVNNYSVMGETGRIQEGRGEWGGGEMDGRKKWHGGSNKERNGVGLQLLSTNTARIAFVHDTENNPHCGLLGLACPF